MKLLATEILLLLTLAGSFSDKAIAQNIDNPSPMRLFVPSKVSLDRNESTYFSMSMPAGDLKIALDTRRSDGSSGNLQSSLSILDSDGAELKANAISFNEIDWSYRRVHDFSLKKPMKL
ncbi:MAG: hypothetical protein M3458_10625 [Acidobacteriota bacterium]|nr:hypothetical protein [Acidobacteriota bacterium]